MMKILVLGGSGMLGYAVVKYLSSIDELSVIATARCGCTIRKCIIEIPKAKWIIFDANQPAIFHIVRNEEPDWIINCIGVIKPYIHDDNPIEVENAIKINSLLPFEIVKTQKKTIQIATDCVFSGEREKYSESDNHDAMDVYGKTKSLGEVKAKNFYNLRCSIIGKELKGHKSLMDWFLLQSPEANIKGYTNHYWNGITTYHYAKMCYAIIRNNISLPNIQHIIPADTVSKAVLLTLMQSIFGRKDIIITPIEQKPAINRTIATIRPQMNEFLWKSAGYDNVPTITQLLEEYKQWLN